MGRASATRRRFAAAAAALVVVLASAYFGRRLWMKTDDLLRPVVVLRGADAAALARPSLRARIAALFGGARVSPEKRMRLVALTFDDGPYPVTTPLLLQTLRELRVPATFFLIGRDAEQFPDLVRAIAADGHEIADHTLTHPNLDELGDAEVTRELRAGAASLERIARDPAERAFFRPPHGRYTVATLRAAQAAGFDTILWSDDPGDWRVIAPAALEDHLFRHAVAPEIVLLHNGSMGTAAALGAVAARYRAAGYTFVTVGELLRRSNADELNRPARTSPDLAR